MRHGNFSNDCTLANIKELRLCLMGYSYSYTYMQQGKKMVFERKNSNFATTGYMPVTQMNCIFPEEYDTLSKVFCEDET